MRVVVSGASGRLGQAVISLLLAQNMQVIGLDKQPVKRPGVNMISLDLCDLGQVFGALAGAENHQSSPSVPADEPSNTPG